MSELERRLAELRDELVWPDAPPFAPVFEAAPRRPARRQGARVLVFGLVIVAVVTAGVLALSPGARSAFLEVFRIRGATVERVEQLPEVDAQRIDFGRPVTRAEAERLVGFELVDLGPPDEIYVRGDRAASLVYGPVTKPRLVLTQLRGGLWDGFVKKIGSQGTRVDRVTVDGEPGLFVSGDEHFVLFTDESGAVREERTYLVGTVLLWNRGPLLLRLEGDLTRAEAIDLATSAR